MKLASLTPTHYLAVITTGWVPTSKVIFALKCTETTYATMLFANVWVYNVPDVVKKNNQFFLSALAYTHRIYTFKQCQI